MSCNAVEIVYRVLSYCWVPLVPQNCIYPLFRMHTWDHHHYSIALDTPDRGCPQIRGDCVGLQSYNFWALHLLQRQRSNCAVEYWSQPRLRFLPPLDLEEVTSRPKLDLESEPKVRKWVLIVDTNVFLDIPSFIKLRQVGQHSRLQITVSMPERFTRSVAALHCVWIYLCSLGPIIEVAGRYGEFAGDWEILEELSKHLRDFIPVVLQKPICPHVWSAWRHFFMIAACRHCWYKLEVWQLSAWLI